MRRLTFGLQRLYARLWDATHLNHGTIPIVKFGTFDEPAKSWEYYRDDAVRRGDPRRWKVTTDHRIGGKSEAQLSLPRRGRPGVASFEGRVSLQLPDGEDTPSIITRSGYAGMHSAKCNLDLEGYTAIILKVRTRVFRMYYLELTTYTTYTPQGNQHRVQFQPLDNDRWHLIRIPFLSFNLWNCGYPIARTAYINLTQIKGIGIVTESEAGEFELDVDSIWVDRDEEEDFFDPDEELEPHPLDGRRVLSFPHVGMTRRRPFFTTRTNRWKTKIEARRLPFIWSPHRLQQIEQELQDEDRLELRLPKYALTTQLYEEAPEGPQNQVVLQTTAGGPTRHSPHAPPPTPPKRRIAHDTPALPQRTDAGAPPAQGTERPPSPPATDAPTPHRKAP